MHFGRIKSWAIPGIITGVLLAGSASAAFRREVPSMASRTFLPFLNRYVGAEGWKVELAKEEAVFTKSDPRRSMKFTVSLYPTEECNIVKRIAGPARTGSAQAAAAGRISIPGRQGSVLRWDEQGVDINDRLWCVVPIRLVRASLVRTRGDDVTTIKFIEREILPQLFDEVRKSTR